MTDFLRHWLQKTQHVPLKKMGFQWAATREWVRTKVAMRSLNLPWIKRHGLSLLGWPGVIGIGLLTACVAFYFSTIRPAQAKLALINHSAAALQDQMNHGLGAGMDRLPPEEQLAEFYRMFPQDRNLPQWLEKIFTSAQSQGIWLRQGEYKVTRDKRGNLILFHMTFPVKGDYPRIRKYLVSLMNDIPTLSLQEAQFKRQKVSEEVVDANIKLVLYLLEQRS